MQLEPIFRVGCHERVSGSGCFVAAFDLSRIALLDAATSLRQSLLRRSLREPFWRASSGGAGLCAGLDDAWHNCFAALSMRAAIAFLRH